LLFAVEYDDRVVFLEVNSHLHFQSEPAGSILLSLHQQCLANEDLAVVARRELRLIERAKALAKSLLPRGSKSRRDDGDVPCEKGS
jgi:hypothetical protein